MLDCKYGQWHWTKNLVETTQTFMVEGELPLGEGRPEIEKVLFCRGYLSEVTGNKDGGKLSVSGRLEIHLIYRGKEPEKGVAEYGMIWQGEKGPAFAAEMEYPEPEAIWDWNVGIKKLTLEPGSGGNVRYRGEIAVEVRARTDEKISVVTALAEAPGIEIAEERALVEGIINVLHGRREVANQFSLTYPRAPLARLVDCLLRPVDVRAEVLPGRVVIEGNLETTLIYVSCDETGEEARLVTEEWNVKNGGAFPFQIVLEEPQARPEQVARPMVRVETLAMQSSHPESWSLQAVLGATVEIIEPRRVQMILDVTGGKEQIIDIDRVSLTMEETVGEMEKGFIVEKILALPSGALIPERVLFADSTPVVLEDARAEMDRVFFEGEAGVSMVYTGKNEDGELQVDTVFWGSGGAGAVKFAEVLEMPGVEPGMKVKVIPGETGVKAEIIDDRTVKINLHFKVGATVREERTFSPVKDCALVPLPEQPRRGILFYLVQPGDTLWEIARRYQTTTAALCQTNNLDRAGAELTTGRKLLIPKMPLKG